MHIFHIKLGVELAINAPDYLVFDNFWVKFFSNTELCTEHMIICQNLFTSIGCHTSFPRKSCPLHFCRTHFLNSVCMQPICRHFYPEQNIIFHSKNNCVWWNEIDWHSSLFPFPKNHYDLLYERLKIRQLMQDFGRQILSHLDRKAVTRRDTTKTREHISAGFFVRGSY